MSGLLFGTKCIEWPYCKTSPDDTMSFGSCDVVPQLGETHGQATQVESSSHDPVRLLPPSDFQAS